VTERHPRMHGERGAALILAIAFMVVIGAISAAVVATTSSGVQDRVALDSARNREYAADGAVERSIASVRANHAVCTSDPDFTYTAPPFPNVSIHVDCAPVPNYIVASDATIAVQNDIVFTACLVADVVSGKCPDAKSIINAQINFQGTGTADHVTTYVQSWSVNR
jgi:hypothetical protein